MRRLIPLLLLCFVSSAAVSLGQTTNEPAPPEDGWFDIGPFLDQKYGFMPVVAPITEPAVGYGAVGGLTLISQPLGEAAAGFDRPDITMVGGMGTENGSWGAFAADVRYWMEDRLQTIAGAIYSSVNLDYHGLGEDSMLAEDPLSYNLEPKGAMLQGKYRVGSSAFWGGLGYAFATTQVTFDAPGATPGVPDFESESNVGSITPSLTYDTRDNIFTPNKGSYVELSAGIASAALGGDDEFQRVRLIGMQYFKLHPKLHLGFRGEAASSFGDVPFYLRPFLYMRGAPIMRYQGEDAAQLESEIRWQFWQRFSIIGFAGTGAVWNDFERFDNSDSVVTGGTGFRYELARKYGIHAGVDVAFGPENTAVYIQFGSAWMRP